jgi:putative cardiolipin synthase
MLFGRKTVATGLLLASLLVGGCASFSLSENREPEYHVLKQQQVSEQPAPQNVVVAAEQYQKNHNTYLHPAVRIWGDEPGQETSRVRIISTGYQAFEDRLRLIQGAEHSIDIQSFAWKGGITGHLLAYQLIQAAERGVKVRVLLDDAVSHYYDIYRTLDYHPNVSVRHYNPFTVRYGLIPFRIIEWMMKPRLNHRMHIKAVIVDNQYSISGSRNLDDRYFDLPTENSIFRDVDLLLAGQVTSDLSHTFDAYWNSRWSVQFSELSSSWSERKYNKKLKKFKKYNDKLPEIAGIMGLTPLEEYQPEKGMVPANIRFVVDSPDKPGDDSRFNWETIARYIEQEADEKVVVANPYVLPYDEVMSHFETLLAKNVQTTVLTNSMASIDFPAAFSGYLFDRKMMLEKGLNLYEYAVDARYPYCNSCEGAESSYHSKFTVIDNDKSVVGSLNYDPRSIDFNTELSFMIDSNEINRQLTELAYYDISANSWHVTKNSPTKWTRMRLDSDERKGDDDTMVMHAPTMEGDPASYTRETMVTEPHADFLRRFNVWFWAILPLKDQL